MKGKKVRVSKVTNYEKRYKIYCRERFNILVKNRNKHLVETFLKISSSKKEASVYLKNILNMNIKMTLICYLYISIEIAHKVIITCAT